MSEVRALIETLIDQGVDPVTAAEVVARAAIEGANSVRPVTSKAAQRQKRYRERNKTSQNVTNHNEVTLCDGGDDEQKEIPPHPPKKNTTPLEPTVLSPTKKPTARSELETVLTPEQAANVLDHRKRLRKPLTAHAAKLLAGKFARCRDPGEAADVMIASGWQAIEPEWIENRNAKTRNGNSKADQRDADIREFRQWAAGRHEEQFGSSQQAVDDFG